MGIVYYKPQPNEVENGALKAFNEEFKQVKNRSVQNKSD